MSAQQKPIDPFFRGRKGFNLIGAATLALGRLADPILQAAILFTPLATPVLQAIGVIHHPAVLPSTSSLLLPQSLAIVPLPRLLLVALHGMNALSQAYWALFTSLEPINLGVALPIVAINTVFASFWSILYLIKATSSAQPDEHLTWTMTAAFGIGIVGLAIETVGEAQRRRFKADPANKGKLFTGGLFGFARHVNYTGFMLSRTGPALLSSGWTAAILTASLFLWDLGGRAARILDEYCGERYGEQWAAYKRVVPSIMIPGIY